MPVATLTSPPPLYADSLPFATTAFDVGEGHVLHVAQHGSPQGQPVLLLHGGPGSGCSPLLRRVLDPRRYRIVCVDQRGAGLSRPRGGIAANDTPRLLGDLRRLREALGIARWLVVGGSWGATLALLHAADLPEAVAGPAAAFDLPRTRHRHRRLLRPARAAAGAGRRAGRHAIARPRAPRRRPGGRTNRRSSASDADPATLTDAELDRQVDRLRVQSHYLLHRCWLGAQPLHERCAQVPAVPTLLLHGRADRVCPPAGAALLHARLPGSRLQWIDGAGHDPAHPAMAGAAVRALDRWAGHGDFADAA